MLIQIIIIAKSFFIVYKYKERRNQTYVINYFHLQEELKPMIVTAC